MLRVLALGFFQVRQAELCDGNTGGFERLDDELAANLDFCLLQTLSLGKYQKAVSKSQIGSHISNYFL
jgi:hypothetical protein